MLEFIVSPKEAGKRLDQYLVGAIHESPNNPHLTRTRIQNIIKKGFVKINQNPQAKISHKIKNGEIISIEIPPPEPNSLTSEPIPLEIIYEDNDLIVINKKPGMVVHPGAGNSQGTLVNALIYHTNNLSEIGGKLRPGIVHRLDKDTSGVMVIAKNDHAHLNLSNQFKERKTIKKYIALVRGIVKQNLGRIEKSIGRDSRERKIISSRTKKAREAITDFKVIERYKNMTLLEVTPKTGRTHQIRVHMAQYGHPIIGDKQYGRKNKEESTLISRQALHAQSLGFMHPRTGQYEEFKATLPDDFKTAIEKGKKDEIF